MNIKKFILQKDAIFTAVIALCLGLVTYLAPCTFTFCKFSSGAEWIEALWFRTGMPFFQGAFIALFVMFPLAAFYDRHRNGVSGCILVALIIALVKHLPNTDPLYLHLNIAYDTVWAMATLVPTFYIDFIAVTIFRKCLSFFHTYGESTKL